MLSREKSEGLEEGVETVEEGDFEAGEDGRHDDKRPAMKGRLGILCRVM